MRFTGLAFAAALAAGGAGAADLTLCVEGAYPPFSWTADDGSVVGFDIDVAQALCAEMGRDCALLSVEWEALIPTLESGRCDAIVASMAITEARRQRIDFTAKYHQTPIRFVAAEGAGWSDDNAGLAGKRLCVQRGTIHQDYLETHFPDAVLVLYATQDEAFLDLESERCDAAMADAVAIADWFVTDEGPSGFAFLGGDHFDPAIHGAGAGIGVRKADAALRDAFSAAIAAIRANGVYREINDRYFDFDVYGPEG
jgi:polar amino acid transport system substrate-binding protein/arginine/ornithine transport system substrate-binding protein